MIIEYKSIQFPSITFSGWYDKSFIIKNRIEGEMSESWLKIILFTFQLELDNIV